VRRRDLILFSSGLVVLIGQRGANAAEMPNKIFRIGRVASTPPSSPGWVAFGQRLAELGYQAGRNLEAGFVEVGGALGDNQAAVAELVHRVDLVVAGGPEVALRAATRASDAIPVVMVAIDYDPLAGGYIASLSRPGSNVTGVFFQQTELSAKRVELLKEASPQLVRAVLFWDAISADQLQAVRAMGASLNISFVEVELRNPPYDYQRALSQADANKAGALMVLSSPFIFRDRAKLAEFALERHLPLISPFRELTDAGGLLSYGASVPGMYRRAAEYADRILTGAKPGDLPVERPTKFELIVNLKTARTLGIDLQSSLLARADEVIE